MNGKIYARYAEGRAKKSKILRNTLRAFLSGGLICTFGEALRQFYSYIGLKP